MGYRRARKTYRLKFEDPDMEGLEVLAHSLALGDFLRVASMAGDVSAQAANADGLFKEFAKALESWNVEDELGVPVPATYEGVCTQEFDFVLAIVTAWMEAMSAVKPPLPGASNNGATFPEGSLPMASLSPSLSS